MRTFKDNAGRTWSVTLNVLQMKRIRAQLGIDLVNVIALDSGGKVKTDLVDRIASDPCLLVDILWVCVGDEAKAAGVTDEEFGRSLAGDSIDEATAAFLDELVDFFPGARRLYLKKAVDLAKKYEMENLWLLEAALNSPEFEERLKTSLRPPSASPESAASTPATSP